MVFGSLCISPRKGVAISILTDREQDAMELIANVIEKATATCSTFSNPLLSLLDSGASRKPNP